ncbi:uncharacterized protein [Rutidosis leptorrhynchoides]|uniref:uncharacterized protein n=1 Tax=Rutidosis leptorrhynchoides TaxID=125765 RepID=UPI003A992F83
MGSCWNGIRQLNNDLAKLNMNFANSFIKVVNNGEDTLFWKDIWLGDQAFSSRFSRIFRLDRNENAKVKDRIQQNGSSWTSTWNWTRQPSGRTTSETDEMNLILSIFKFGNQGEDNWRCSLFGDKEFSTFRLTELLNEKLILVQEGFTAKIHNNLIPRKIGVFVWRAQHNRLPVTTELGKNGIDLDSLRCPVCDDGLETLDHVLYNCCFAKEVWKRCFQWWGKSLHNNSSVPDLMFENMSMGNKIDKMWQACVWVTAYLIWHNRNNLVYLKIRWTEPMILKKIQVRSFEWISNRAKDIEIDWLKWMSNPILMS